MLVGNGLYWVVKDYYKEKGQTFVNAFGRLFKDYIVDLADTYCLPSELIRLKEGKNKRADFLFVFENVQLLVEAKSSLLGLEGKQQVPNSNVIDKFFQSTIQKAYQQLTTCYEEVAAVKKPTLKVILLYDEFSNTAILEQSIEGFFLNDSTCYIMTICELEILLYAHRYDNQKFDEALHRLAFPEENSRGRKTVSSVLDTLSLNENYHFEGELDYFQKLMSYFE